MKRKADPCKDVKLTPIYLNTVLLFFNNDNNFKNSFMSQYDRLINAMQQKTLLHCLIINCNVIPLLILYF